MNTYYKKKDRGFTFIELLVVVVILLSLVMLSTPRFIRSYRYLSFNNAKKDIHDLAHTLQQMAVLKGKTLRISLDKEQNTLVIATRKLSNGILDWVRITHTLFKPYVLPDKLSLEMSPQAILFYPDGHLMKATILIKDSFGHTAKLIFNPEKGTILLDNEKK